MGYSPQICIDIGAYNGDWTKEFKGIFEKSAVMMIEGQVEKEPLLKRAKALLNNVDYYIGLLGSNESEVDFNIYDTASSVLNEYNITNARIERRQLIKLDTIVKGTPFEKPDFIKLDTQGYELEILKGSGNILQYAEFVLMEVSFIDIYKGCPLVHDVLKFMHERGFVVFDICTLMRRPLDKSLFQSDFLFVKETSEFRSDKRWS